MSEIFLATQSGLGGFNKLVVLKTILPDISGEEDFVRMFLDEARTTAAFNHPNIAQVYELDVADGQLFMAMEFVQGCTLVEMARACRLAKEPIPVGFTLQAVRDTALALNYAHAFTDARGRKQVVIHRDVAEKNIMVTYEGVTKLLDFGIAKALGRVNRTTIGMVKGTSGYMSPEQIRGEPLDGRSDIFALGVVLHECLTGMRLFHGKKPEDGMLAALKETVAPPSKLNSEVSPEVDAIVLKSLSRNRDDRFSTALEMARAIEKAAVGLIWHPEQTAELVTKHFSERRQETRRLLEGSSYAESTGEVRIDSLMARVKASQGESPRVVTAPIVSPSAVAPPPVAATPPIAPRAQSGPIPAAPATRPLGSNSAAPAQSMPSVSGGSSPPNSKRADVIGRAGEKMSTAPDRPKVLREGEGAKPISLPGALPMNQSAAGMYGRNDFDDESEAKTIPAAALPEDIKELRKQLQERRREAEIVKHTQTGVPRQAITEPGAMPAFEPAAAPPPPAAPAPVHAKKGTPEKPAPVLSPRQPAKTTPDKPAVAHEPLFPSGEVQSVTSHMPPESEGAELTPAPQPVTDFEEDGLTNVAAPEWVPPSAPPPPVRRQTTNSTKARRAKEAQAQAPRGPKRNVLIAIIVVSLLIALACVVIFALDLGNESPRNIGTPEHPSTSRQ